MTTIRELIINEWPEQKDLLQRGPVAAHLTAYLVEKHRTALEAKAEPPSYVLNLDARYGLGKTHFIECWTESLQAAGAKVIQFNAWESDYSDQALISFTTELLAQLEPLLPDNQSKNLSKIWDVAKSAAGPVLLGMAARAVTGMGVEYLTSVATDPDKVADTAGEILEKVADKLLDEYQQKRTAADAAKLALAEAVEAIRGTRSASEAAEGVAVDWPLFVFVDELDRCRPNYAIEVLESIKHVFQVPGIHFIIATDREQLAHAVGAVYGPSFDGAFYLRRFFDRRLTLPPPSCKSFASALFEARFSHAELKQHFVPSSSDLHGPEVVELFARLMQVLKIPLRCQIQIADEYEVCASLLQAEKKTIHAGFVLPALCLKNMPQFHSAFQVLIEAPARWADDQRQFGVPEEAVFTSSHWGERTGKHRKVPVSVEELIGVYAKFRTGARIGDNSPEWVQSIGGELDREHQRAWVRGGVKKADIGYLWDIVAFSSFCRAPE